MNCRRLFALLASIATATMFGSWAIAQEEGHSVVVDVQGGAVEVDVQGPVVHQPMPAPALETEVHLPPAPAIVEGPAVNFQPAPACRPIAVVREISTLSAKRAYRCHGAPIHQQLCVTNPADCNRCLFGVRVCVPACCVGQPVCVSQRAGLLGRGYATYRWQCGFEVTVTFLVRGGVILTYR